MYNDNGFDSKRFIARLSHIAENAEFFKWHDGVVGAMRRYCNICMVDHAIIEVAIGVKLESLCVKS